MKADGIQLKRVASTNGGGIYAQSYSSSGTANNVTITNNIRETLPNDEGFIIETNTNAQVLIVTLDDDTVTENRYLDMENEKLRFSYAFLKAGEAVNDDNKATNRSITFTVQISANETLNIAVRHQTVDNRGLADIAEQKATAQIAGLIQESYKVLTQ